MSWGANYHHQEGCSVVGGSPNWCRSALPVNADGNRAQRRLRRHSLPVPRRHHPRSRDVFLRGGLAVRQPGVGRHARAGGALVHVGQPRGQCAAQQQQSVGQLHPRHRVRQPERHADARAGAPHAQDRLLLLQELSAARPGRVRRHDQLRAGHRRHQCVRHVVRIRQRRDRLLQFLFPAVALGRGRLHGDQSRRLRSGQLEGHQQPDARLRRPSGPSGAPVRRLSAGIEFPARDVGGRRCAAALRCRLRQRRESLHRQRTVRP